MERLRLVPNGTYPVTVRTVDEDGAPVTIGGTPTVKIYDGSGTQVGTTGTPTPAAGTVSYVIPAGVLTELDTYELVFSGTVGGAPYRVVYRLELVGGFLFEVPDLRAFDAAFGDATRYPAELVRAARTAAEERFERACRQAFVPRGRRTFKVGSGTARVHVSDNALRRLVSVAVDGIELTEAEIEETIVREWGAFDRPSGKVWSELAAIRLHYEHGLDAPTPEVSQAAMLLAREYLVRSNLSSRATVEATDVGFFRLSVAGPDRPTGLPEVDAVIRAVGRNRPQIG